MLEERSIISENGEVFYYTSINGKAKTIFFLHGLGVDHNTFINQVEYFSKEYNVITWDAPLHSKSRPYINFSINNCVNELNKILEIEKIDKVILVGQSMGGVISQHFIDRYKGKAELLIGIGSPPVGLNYLTKFDGKLLKLSTFLFNIIPYSFIIKSSTKANSVTDYGRSYVDKIFRLYSKKELIELTEVGFMQMVYENRDVVIDCPTLAIFGDREGIGKSKSFRKYWEVISKRPVKLIKNAGHLSNMDNPIEVNNIIEEFIKTHSKF